MDALAFVAAIQVEFLFEGAKDPKALREALNTRVKALAVGRVTADALREWGSSPSTWTRPSGWEACFRASNAPCKRRWRDLLPPDAGPKGPPRPPPRRGARDLREAQGPPRGGARVTVLAEEDAFGLEALEREGKIRWLKRAYREGDLEGYFLVISHPKDKAIHPRVKAEADRRGVFLVAVDDPQNASAILPAVLRRGELLVALSTSGAAPALAVRLKERLAGLFPEAYGELVAFLRTLRPRIAQIPSFEERKRLWYRIVDQALEELDLDPKEGLGRAKEKAQEALKEVAAWTR